MWYRDSLKTTFKNAGCCRGARGRGRPWFEPSPVAPPRGPAASPPCSRTAPQDQGPDGRPPQGGRLPAGAAGRAAFRLRSDRDRTGQAGGGASAPACAGHGCRPPRWPPRWVFHARCCALSCCNVASASRRDPPSLLFLSAGQAAPGPQASDSAASAMAAPRAGGDTGAPAFLNVFSASPPCVRASGSMTSQVQDELCWLLPGTSPRVSQGAWVPALGLAGLEGTVSEAQEASVCKQPRPWPLRLKPGMTCTPPVAGRLTGPVSAGRRRGGGASEDGRRATGEPEPLLTLRPPSLRRISGRGRGRERERENCHARVWLKRLGERWKG